MKIVSSKDYRNYLFRAASAARLPFEETQLLRDNARNQLSNTRPSPADTLGARYSRLRQCPQTNIRACDSTALIARVFFRSAAFLARQLLSINVERNYSWSTKIQDRALIAKAQV
jgi:hypothetical protein